jgi:hypothetical protein
MPERQKTERTTDTRKNRWTDGQNIREKQTMTALTVVFLSVCTISTDSLRQENTQDYQLILNNQTNFKVFIDKKHRKI